jgi:hypothetical protein
MANRYGFSAFLHDDGRSVQAAPRAEGFELIAWIEPFAVFAAGLLGTILLVRRWTGVPHGQEMADDVNAFQTGGHPL